MGFQSEANKIALGKARQRMKERCAADPVYRQKFVNASRKGSAVLKQMRANGELVLSDSQRAALATGREMMWKDDKFRDMRRRISSNTMTKTNHRRGAGEFPEWTANNKRAAAATLSILWGNESHRIKMQHVMSRAIKSAWNGPGYRLKQAQRISAMHKKLWADPEYRKKMESRTRSLGRPSQRVVFIDRKLRIIVFKSRWEKEFAIWLDSNLLDWKYEPLAIDLRNGHRYFPDFWVEQWDCFVEIKGRDWGLDKVKIALDLGWKIEIVRSISSLSLLELGKAHSGSPWK